MKCFALLALFIFLQGCTHTQIHPVEKAEIQPPKKQLTVSENKIPNTEVTQVLPSEASASRERSISLSSQIPIMIITFAPASSWVGQRSQLRLKNLAGILAKNKDLFESVEIIGFADGQGRPDLNMQISQKRALTISDIMRKAGLPNSRLTAKQEIERENTQEELRANRRVEIVLKGVRNEEKLMDLLSTF